MNVWYCPLTSRKIPAREATETHTPDFVVNDELLTIHSESTHIALA